MIARAAASITHAAKGGAARHRATPHRTLLSETHWATLSWVRAVVLAGGRICFASYDEYRAHYDAFLGKGSVFVEGTALPPALVPFAFTLSIAGIPDEIPLNGMVVTGAPGGVLVQLLGLDAGTKRRLDQPAPPPPPAAERPDTMPQMGVPGYPPMPPGMMPAGYPGYPAMPMMPPGMMPPGYPGYPAMPPGMMPPGMMPPGYPGYPAMPPGMMPPGYPGYPAMPPGYPGMPAPQGGLPAGVTPASQPLGAFSGELKNPIAIADMLQLPLGTNPVIAALSPISVVGLLRYLGSRRASGKLLLRGPDSAERTVAFEQGMVMASAAEREASRTAMTWESGQYSFEPGIEAHAATRSATSPMRVAVEGVRATLRGISLELLRESVDTARAVRVSAVFLERSRTLDLAAAEERAVRRDFDGRLSVAELLKIGSVSEIGLYRLILFLEIVGLLEYVDPQGVGELEDEVRAYHDRMSSGDHFSALSIHWTDAPERIAPAIKDIEKRYGPDSLAAAKSPEWAKKIVEHATWAAKQLADKDFRRKYREELGHNVRYAAEMLVGQVPLAKARGEWKPALALMNAACDLHDDPEWEQMRFKVKSMVIAP